MTNNRHMIRGASCWGEHPPSFPPRQGGFGFSVDKCCRARKFATRPGYRPGYHLRSLPTSALGTWFSARPLINFQSNPTQPVKHVLYHTYISSRRRGKQARERGMLPLSLQTRLSVDRPMATPTPSHNIGTYCLLARKCTTPYRRADPWVSADRLATRLQAP